MLISFGGKEGVKHPRGDEKPKIKLGYEDPVLQLPCNHETCIILPNIQR